jgi:hypothetical protein
MEGATVVGYILPPDGRKNDLRRLHIAQRLRDTAHQHSVRLSTRVAR